MTLDHHLWACALEVERQHGDGAFLFASMRVDEMGAEACWEGASTWRQILQRVTALEQSDDELRH